MNRVLAFMCASFFSVSALAAGNQATHTFNDPNSSAIVDDDGGFTGRFRYIFEGVDQFGEGSLMVWDGGQSLDGRHDNDFANGGSNSLDVFDAGGNFGIADQVSGSQMNPYMPAVLTRGSIQIEQSSFTIDTRNWVIYAWTITNVGGSTINEPKVLFLIDWDLNDTENDVSVGWDASRNLAWQQDGPANGDNNYTTGGISLLSGSLDNYHLGNCCALRDDEEVEPGAGRAQAQYFIGLGWGGNVDNGDPDKEIGVSALLPALAPNDSATVAFVQAIAKGSNSVQSTSQLQAEAEGLANLQAEVDSALAAWQSISGEGVDFNINASVNDAWFNPLTNGQGFFITAFPVLETMFVAWFTFETDAADPVDEANLGDARHRWLTAYGPYVGNTAVLDIEVTSGGIFDTPPGDDLVQVEDGTLTVEFAGCNEAMITYDIESANLQGEIPLQRIAEDNIQYCEDTQGQAALQ